MKKFLALFGFVGAVMLSGAANSASVGTVTTTNAARGSVSHYVPKADSNLRGNAGVAGAYKTNQRNTYFIVNQPDVDTACREKIFACLSDYCGDVTIIPGQRESRCMYATESELYNYALLCLQRDTEILLPQYGVNTYSGKNGANTAAQLCPSYVQQELMSYLSMANMANQLVKSHSDLCLTRRQELEAAMACHSVALAYGTQTSSQLESQLTDFCGAGVPGGSAEMVMRFKNAGNVGANIWDWAEKMISLDLNKKADGWEAAVDSVLAGYTNRMNLACGDNLQLNLTAHATSSSGAPSALQTVAALAVGATLSSDTQKTPNPYETQSLWKEITSRSEIYTYDDAYQVVNAGITNPSTIPSSFLNSAQMDDMKTAYIRGTKVFVIRDSARCYIVPVTNLTPSEQSLVAQSLANCISR
ncbi:MAG: hypothetical protein IKW67_01775 [Alphaproteobacteria bacterium]|nr:hypothetical protein [Alphaproteobacteria bacterium]